MNLNLCEVNFNNTKLVLGSERSQEGFNAHGENQPNLETEVTSGPMRGYQWSHEMDLDPILFCKIKLVLFITVGKQ